MSRPLSPRRAQSFPDSLNVEQSNQANRKLAYLKDLIANGRVGGLALAIRDRLFTPDVWLALGQHLGTKTLERVLCAGTERPLQTTPIHELFRYADEDLIFWLINTCSDAIQRLASGQDLQTPLHVLAQRANDQSDEQSTCLAYVMEQASQCALLAADSSGNTVAHYLAVYNHVEALRVVERRAPTACFVPNHAGQRAFLLHLARMRAQVRVAEDERQRTRDHNESMIEMLQEADRALRERDATIEGLRRQVEELNWALDKHKD